MVIDGQPDGSVHSDVPGRRRLRAFNGQAEAALHAVRERRDDAGEVRGVGLEPSGADQSAQVGDRPGAQICRDVERTTVVVHDLRVCPRPRLREVGQLGSRIGRVGDRQHGQQRAAAVLDGDPVARPHDDEHAPRPQPVLRPRCGGGEQPRQVRRVELDDGEIVGLDGDRSGSRVAAQDDPRVQSGDIAGTVQLDQPARGRPVAQVESDGESSPGRQCAVRVRAGDRRGEAASGPRQEAVGRGHHPTSWLSRMRSPGAACSASGRQRVTAGSSGCT